MSTVALSRTPAQVEAFRAVVQNGGTIKDAMLAAGYSETTANHGLERLPDCFMGVLRERLAYFAQLGQSVSVGQQEGIVRGRLLANVLEGRDMAVRSAELLGKEKRVNMFTADSQVGVIVLGGSMPDKLAKLAEVECEQSETDSPVTIDAEIIPSESE